MTRAAPPCCVALLLLAASSGCRPLAVPAARRVKDLADDQG